MARLEAEKGLKEGLIEKSSTGKSGRCRENAVSWSRDQVLLNVWTHIWHSCKPQLMVRKAKLVTRWDFRLKTDFSRERVQEMKITGGWGFVLEARWSKRKSWAYTLALWRCEETQVRWQGERRQWVETARRQKTRVRSWDYTLKARGSVPASPKQGWIFKTLETICIRLHSSYSNFKTVGHSPCCLCTEVVYTCVYVRCLPPSLSTQLRTSLGDQQASGILLSPPPQSLDSSLLQLS